MNKGDIFNWHYKSTDGMFSPYHCCSCIAEFDGQFLRDTFWNSGSDVRRWSETDAINKLELTLIANHDDLDQMNPDAHHYYDDGDVVDLRHPNNSSRGLVYIRRGSKRSADKMRETIHHTIQRSQSEISFAEDRIERCQKDLKTINSGNLNIYINP